MVPFDCWRPTIAERVRIRETGTAVTVVLLLPRDRYLVEHDPAPRRQPEGRLVEQRAEARREVRALEELALLL